MLRATGSKCAGASTTSVRSLEMQPPSTFMFSAKSLNLQLVHELRETRKFANADHFAVLSIDGKPVSKPGHKTTMPAPRWPSFNFNISSVVKIAIFHSGGIGKNILVAQYNGQGHDFLERNTKYGLTDGAGSPIDLCLSVNVDLISHSPDYNPTRDKQTFNTITTSGTVNNVAGDFVVHGAYNVFQEPTDSTIHTSARVQGIQNDQMEEKIEKWMDAPDTSPNFNAARKKHTPDTGSWFLDGSAFKRWKEGPDVLLWLHGGPGCGKTILCASVIKAIIHFCDSKTSTGYAYFFFDGTSAEAAHLVHDKLVRSIMMQLAHRCDGMPAALAEMYRKYDKGSRQPPIEILEATLNDVLESFDNVYIVIDSLDECSERKELLEWIQSMSSRASGKLHMAVSSRPEPEIMQGLRALSQLNAICISGHQTESDIRAYLNTRLSQRDAAKWTNAQKEMIRATLMDGADGMFRWVALQADQLMKCASPQELKKQLKSLPRDLNETYSRTLSESPDPGNLKRILQWLAYSTRAMAIEEIAEVAVIDFGEDDSGLPMYEVDRRFADPDHVLSLCYGLVTEVEVYIHHKKDYRSRPLRRGVKLAHFSVKEYLISEHILSRAAANFHTDEKMSHSIIAQTSLAYLLHFDKFESLTRSTVPLFPLAHYAAEHWVAHFHSAGSDHGGPAILRQLALNLFEASPSHAMHNSIWLYDDGVDFDDSYYGFASPLYYACRSGVTTVIENLINKGADLNDNRGRFGPPLTVASSIGHLEVVQLLLAFGADVEVVQGRQGTSLQTASSEGHLEIVQLLLAHGADINSSQGDFGTALQRASSGGHLEIAQLLLVHGADIEVSRTYEGTSLSAASSEGHLEIVQLLLAHGANVNSSRGSFGTALQRASSGGHLQVVQLLLVHGADVAAEEGPHGAALQQACSGRSLEIVQLLLAYGANVNAESRYGDTPLGAAAEGNNTAIVQLLLAHGAKGIAKLRYSETALVRKSPLDNVVHHRHYSWCNIGCAL